MSCENSERKIRNSNIELLRIISTFLIIAFHMRRYNYIWSSKPIGYIFGTIFSSWGVLGVDIFLIISAYFLSESKFHIKKVINIVFQTFSWIILFTCVYAVYSYIKLGGGQL